MAMKLILKGQDLLKLSGEPNAHRFSLKAKTSYPTVDRYINRPDTVQAYGATVMAAMFVDGLGMTPEQILAMPMSTFFDIVEVDED